jgi:ubiquinone biosynthesis protein UbiJ
MIGPLVNSALLAGLRHLMRRETWAQAALLPYAGRSARLVAGALTLDLGVGSDGQLVAGSGTPAVRIELPPGQLARLPLDPEGALRDVRLEGDAGFARALLEVLARLRPDPAEDLAAWMGDAAAQRFVGSAQAAGTLARDTAGRLAQQAAAALVGEWGVLAGRLQLQSLAAEREQLEARLAQLEVRLNARLNARPAAPARVSSRP